jgi:acetyl-CoA carboxylase carboxyl transferase subunit beta
VVTVALAAERDQRVTPDGYRLATRAAELAGRLGLPLVTFVDTVGADPLPHSEDAGVARTIADAMTAVLTCPSPTLSVLHGEGGSGGALAAATTDLVAVTPTGWFAALGPEGASAALRSSPEQAAELMRVTPANLLEDGFADATAPGEPEPLRSWLLDRLGQLTAEDPEVRLARRDRRWRGALPR